jgi:hypothetical protein
MSSDTRRSVLQPAQRVQLAAHALLLLVGQVGDHQNLEVRPAPAHRAPLPGHRLGLPDAGLPACAAPERVVHQ